ncbi:hypothetical protein CRG98_018157 [Punica granatum]|uniref:Uncharacterized protein n=1 Tax=Punica granatum TaxID=22663 RepID=A0A2I0JYQ1_PUNGR|nr:hypothetical protein CRG98_018157 [Punica granatum]
MVKRQRLYTRHRGFICPKAQARLEEYRSRCGGWVPLWCRNPHMALFEVPEKPPPVMPPYCTQITTETMRAITAGTTARFAAYFNPRGLPPPHLPQ